MSMLSSERKFELDLAYGKKLNEEIAAEILLKPELREKVLALSENDRLHWMLRQAYEMGVDDCISDFNND
jgi:hypothetical protein